MTILHVADLHFTSHWFRWLLNEAPPHDLLVIAGDILSLDSSLTHAAQVEWLARNWFEVYDRPVALCSGRHDLVWSCSGEVWQPAGWLRSFAGPSTWVDGDRFNLHGLSFLSIGCATQPRGGLANIWITHAPPTGAATARTAGGGDGGDFRLATAFLKYKPQMVLSGQVHAPDQWCEWLDDTLMLNPGSTPMARFPNHILINTDQRTLSRITAAPWGPVVETRHFDEVPTAVSRRLSSSLA